MGINGGSPKTDKSKILVGDLIGIWMVIEWWLNGDLMVINPLVMEYEWLVGVLEHEILWLPQ